MNIFISGGKTRMSIDMLSVMGLFCKILTENIKR